VLANLAAKKPNTQFFSTMYYIAEQYKNGGAWDLLIRNGIFTHELFSLGILHIK